MSHLCLCHFESALCHPCVLCFCFCVFLLHLSTVTFPLCIQLANYVHHGTRKWGQSQKFEVKEESYHCHIITAATATISAICVTQFILASSKPANTKCHPADPFSTAPEIYTTSCNRALTLHDHLLPCACCGILHLRLGGKWHWED